MQAAVVPAVNSRWELREVPASEPGPNQLSQVNTAYDRVADGRVRFRAVIVN